MYEPDCEEGKRIYIDAILHLGMNSEHFWQVEERARRDSHDWRGLIIPLLPRCTFFPSFPLGNMLQQSPDPDPQLDGGFCVYRSIAHQLPIMDKILPKPYAASARKHTREASLQVVFDSMDCISRMCASVKAFPVSPLGLPPATRFRPRWWVFCAALQSNIQILNSSPFPFEV